jgi:hypothetical protein
MSWQGSFKPRDDFKSRPVRLAGGKAYELPDT